MILPPEAHQLVQVLALHSTDPTYQRLVALLVGAVLTAGGPSPTSSVSSGTSPRTPDGIIVIGGGYDGSLRLWGAGQYTRTRTH